MELPFLLLVALFTAAAQGQYQTTGTPSDQNTQPYTDYDYFKAAAPAINYRLCSKLYTLLPYAAFGSVFASYTSTYYTAFGFLTLDGLDSGLDF